jgi:hypothetical protein
VVKRPRYGRDVAALIRLPRVLPVALPRPAIIGSVECSNPIKSRRRNAPPAIPASATRQDSWTDEIPPDDLPERDVHADLADHAGQLRWRIH